MKKKIGTVVKVKPLGKKPGPVKGGKKMKMKDC